MADFTNYRPTTNQFYSQKQQQQQQTYNPQPLCPYNQCDLKGARSKFKNELIYVYCSNCKNSGQSVTKNNDARRVEEAKASYAASSGNAPAPPVDNNNYDNNNKTLVQPTTFTTPTPNVKNTYNQMVYVPITKLDELNETMKVLNDQKDELLHRLDKLNEKLNEIHSKIV